MRDPADTTVQTIFFESSEVEIPLNEIARYMGMGHSRPDARLAGLMEKARDDFQKAARYTVCYRETPVSVTETKTDFGVFAAEGKSLAGHLAGCSRALLFAATAGIETERQRKRAFVSSPSLALVPDAVGTAAIESLCDRLCGQWARKCSGWTLRSRFSPGYGDFPLSAQRPLLDSLNARQTAGIALTDALLMVPQKSVSAVIGMEQTSYAAEAPPACPEREHCQACGRRDCAFRLKGDELK